jgi:hypothetical protein
MYNVLCHGYLSGPRVTTPEPTPNPCNSQEGFSPFKSGCYKYVALGANWTAAADSCHTLGARLVTITDAFVQVLYVGAENQLHKYSKADVDELGR